MDKFDRETFNVIIGGGRNSIVSTYAFISQSVFTETQYKGKKINVEFQNGLEFIANNFDCPSESLSLYTDHMESWACDLWYEEDPEFVTFIEGLKEQAEKFLKKFDQDSEILDEIADLYDCLPIDRYEFETLACDKDVKGLLEALKDLEKEEDARKAEEDSNISKLEAEGERQMNEYYEDLEEGERSSRFHAIADKFPPRGVWLEFFDGKKTMGDTPPFNHIDKLGKYDCKINYLHNYTHWRKLSKPDEIMEGL